MKGRSLHREQARRLRRDSTDAERRLWKQLRDRKIAGAKFRRQVPIGPYIADFACLEVKLIVEVDGEQHAEPGIDTVRTSFLEADGFRVLHLWNNDVMANIEGVVAVIERALRKEPR
ncbi:MAG: endonuclease domain-containing protein [Alphaproteobacteria bacterium]|nr:endonuclease domain-containing protein [Alphaproteobacteria bacterium]